jgi:hypothetical protein
MATLEPDNDYWRDREAAILKQLVSVIEPSLLATVTPATITPTTPTTPSSRYSSNGEDADYRTLTGTYQFGVQFTLPLFPQDHPKGYLRSIGWKAVDGHGRPARPLDNKMAWLRWAVDADTKKMPL